MKILLIFLLLLSSKQEEHFGCMQVDLIFLVDMSASVQGNERFISQALLSFAENIQLSEESVEMGIVVFNLGTVIFTELSADQIEVKRNMIALSTYQSMGTTNLTIGLYAALDQFIKHGRPNYRKMIILISDGDVDNPDESMDITNQLKQAQIHFCTIMIKDTVSRSVFMKAISSDCYVESNYQDLVEEMKKMDICM